MIRLWTLGTLDLHDDDGCELRAVLAQPKRFAILAYLALATPRGFQRRDTLLALFWPEHDGEHARNALSQAAHFLRRSLGREVLVSRGDEELGLDWAAVWCDAVAFKEALAASRPTDALALYRGALLSGFHLSEGALAFGRWLETERERLAGGYARAVEHVAESREAAGDYRGALGWWQRLAAHELYDSRIALRLMRALAAMGNPAGAIQHARVHETLLRTELGVAAGSEILALARELQAGQAEEHYH